MTGYTPPVPGRHNMYYAIHKTLRLGHARLIAQLTATDWQDPDETAAALTALRGFLAMAANHLNGEETFIHPALEAAEPGSSDTAHEGHDHHEQAFAELESLARAVETATGPARDTAGQRLYFRYALFAAEDIEHMAEEETHLLGAMHRLFGDDDLRAIEGRIIAKIDPADMTRTMALMAPALSTPELAGMLSEMRHAMPPEVFSGFLAAAVAPALPPVRFARIEALLAPQPA
ncbi:hemerythrin domain-containing protein [Pseudooceanicola sp. LIPI14-2-Ac024]|uniref:hemerythrin domain-containing protein n=1 Tax=Pseudooceanicola sp. LIPI14-2-Ac024 TaxID=3344875 RepID=UPI0035D06E64